MRRRGKEKLAGSGERGDKIKSLGQSRRWEDVTWHQDARNIATQVRMHRRCRTQEIHHWRQDAMQTDQTENPFLLI